MEFLNTPELQGLASVVGLLTLLKLLYEKTLYIFSLNDFDKVFIPHNKVKIYESLKFLLSIIAINLCLYLFASSISENILIPKELVVDTQTILSYILNISLLALLCIVASVKILRKVKKVISSKLKEGKKLIEDWVIVFALLCIHVLTLIVILLTLYYQVCKYKQIKDLTIDISVAFITITITSIIYLAFIYILIRFMRNRKGKEAKFMLINSEYRDLYVIGSKESDILVLGNESTYEKSNEICLFSIKDKNYIEFKKIDIV